MTNLDALKELCAAVATKGGEEVSPADVKGDTSADVIRLITRAYKGESIFDDELPKLTLSSEAGASVGHTKITVSGATGTGAYKYKATGTLPSLGEDLSTWTSWDGTSEIEAEDSSVLAICEVDDRNLAVAGGTVFVTSNLGE